MTALLWVRDNMLIALLMCAVTTAGAASYQAGEIAANAYKLLGDQWPKCSRPMKAKIAEAMQDGKITRWEYAALFRALIDDTHGFALPIESQSVEQERAALQMEVTHGLQ